MARSRAGNTTGTASDMRWRADVPRQPVDRIGGARIGRQPNDALRLAAQICAVAGRHDWRAAITGGSHAGNRAVVWRSGAPARMGDHPKKVVEHPLRNSRGRYAHIKTMKGKHPIRVLCELLAVSRSGYYRWQEPATDSPNRARFAARRTDHAPRR